MTGYLVQEATPEEVAAEDPFRGGGMFLPCPGEIEEILGAVEEAFGGPVPAVAWPGRGAWIDRTATGITPGEVRDFWACRG